MLRIRIGVVLCVGVRQFDLCHSNKSLLADVIQIVLQPTLVSHVNLVAT